MFAASLCIPRLDVGSAEEVMCALAARLEAQGKVRPSFERAALARERRSPTGLPFAAGSVAMPHAEPEHVIEPGVAVATLARPVSFRQMGAPAIVLEVSLVVMPALTAKEQAAAGLARLIDLLQSEPLHAALRDATTAEAMNDAIEQARARAETTPR